MKRYVRAMLSGSIAVLCVGTFAACGGNTTTLGAEDQAQLPAGISQADVDKLNNALASDKSTTCTNWRNDPSGYVDLLMLARPKVGTKDAWAGLAQDWLQKNC